MAILDAPENNLLSHSYLSLPFCLFLHDSVHQLSTSTVSSFFLLHFSFLFELIMISTKCKITHPHPAHVYLHTGDLTSENSEVCLFVKLRIIYLQFHIYTGSGCILTL